MPTGSYLYAVGRDVSADQLAGVPALSEEPLAVLRHRDLCAVLSEVDLDEYGEQGLRRNLERLDWVERVARTHDQVVRAVHRLTPTAPVRLATIFLGADGLRSRLDRWHDGLVEVLDQVAEHDEWSVKLFAGPAPVPVGGAAPAAETGAAYLMRKRQEARAVEDRRLEAARAGERLHEELTAIAVAHRLLPAQDPQLTGRTDTMVRNGAYLVPAVRRQELVEALTARADDLAGSGLTVEWQGPWPPYSFATLDRS